MDVYFAIFVWLQSTIKMGAFQSPQSVNLYFVLIIGKSVTIDAHVHINMLVNIHITLYPFYKMMIHLCVPL